MITHNFKTESGRSMVEMLGTLAIIGVLSIGGIAGYSYGMDKYRANRTMNDVRLRAMDVLAQFNATGDASLDNWKNEKTIYPITLEDETIGIQVDKVPERVCEMMAEGMKHSSSAIKINAEYVEEDASDCGDDNTLVFYFDDEPTEDEGTVNEPVREQCGETLCEQCFTCDESTMTCVSIAETMIPNNLDDLRICASNGYKSYCGVAAELYGSADMGCINLGSCSGDPECNALIDGRCEALDSTMFLQMGVGGFRCTKNGQEGYCMEGVCDTSSSCSSDSDCTNTAKPFCSDNGTCGECTQDSHCGDTVSDYCSYGYCYKCSTSYPYRDTEENTCAECLEDSHCGDPTSNYCKKGFCYTCPSDTPYWNAPNGTCGTCLEDSHCTDTTRPFCAKDGVCGICSQDSHCTDATRPFCNDRGMCVECTSDTHCDTGQYCGGSILSNSCSVAYPSGCDDLKYTTHPITYTDANGISKTETFYVSKNKLNGWDAEATCRALNKEMLSVHDLVTGWDGSSDTYPKTALFDALYNVLSDKWDVLWMKGETTVSVCFTKAVKPDGTVYSHGSVPAYYYVVCH